MPPKGKSSKADWQQCTSCGVILATKDVTLHEHCCSKLSGDDDPKHDFIRDCVLHGTLQALPADDTAGLSNSTKSQLLYLNPSCMRMCDIGIKDVVELCEDGERHLLVAWPSRNIGLTGVSIHRQPKPSVPRKVTVAKHSDCIVGASSVTLMPDEKLQQVSVLELQRCILQQNLGVFVRTGSKLQCRVYGHDLRFTVLSAKGEGGLSSGDLLRSSSVDGDDLEEKLQHLTVSEGHSSPSASKTPRPSSAQVHSTPPQRMPLTPSRQGPAAFNTPKAPEGRAGSRISLAVFHRITIGTEVTVMEEGSVGPEVSHRAGYDQIGGLDREIQQLRELVEVPARHPATFSRFGLKPPRGALLFGPPGTGKTLLARAVAAESGASLVVLDGPQVFSKYYGETEAALRNVFKDAVERAPSVLFVDEIDALCPKREAGTSSQEARAVSTLVALLDNLPSMQEKWVLVLGATNRPNNVDPSLRQPGRLDRELEIGVPTASGRLQILRKILGNVRHSLSDEDIVETADAAHGLTGADLAAMCAEAALHSLDRHLKDPTATDAVLSHEVELNMADVAAALKRTKPSAMREVSLEIPKVRWSDIGGMEEVKLKLRQAVEWPWKHREAFERLGATPPHGLLLYGPPGCSKTMVAKALATESGLNFIAIKGPELFSKWVGDSERAVRELFRKARTAAPCIIFFDEIDALAAHRGSTSGSSNVGDRVIAQLLAEMDGIEALQDVVLVAATNRPDMIDQALMRPGRLDSIVYVPLPDLDTRREILRINLSKRPLGDSVSLDDLARKTEGYSGAEVVAVCQEAALIALEEDIEARHITALHLEAALQLVRPRISQETVQYYESYWASTGKGRHSRPGLG
ncbi:ATPase family protein 2 homolog isoform X2 [Ixodes scapularis]|uniref:ATPase family protein 2 homolog isoform X2 n=1 Tax=Ixodes scapularis TaxID=6945 RepID=UPI001AD74949|nr:ATPase family protein 2 homolog isoform X2 [Ixodes scapularis]